MFYEAHQARWVAGEFPTEALKQEPQGKFSAPQAALSLPTASTTTATPATANAGAVITAPTNDTSRSPTSPSTTPIISGETPTSNTRATDSAAPADPGKPLTHQANTTVNEFSGTKTNSSTSSENSAIPNATTSRTETLPGTPVPRELAPLVQQQLDGLASQNFAWQGQLWPGQQMQWEIGEDPSAPRAANDDQAQRWLTRLKLSLPSLGDIDVTLRLQRSGDVSIALTAGSDSTGTLLRNQTAQLQQQFDSAGLNLTELLVQHGESAT